MVNFSDSATAADLTSPEGVARFEEFYAALSLPRLAGGFKAFHVWRDSSGYHNPDFNLLGVSLEAIVADAQSVLLAVHPDHPIPPQPRELWWEFWRRPLVKAYMHYPMETHRRRSVFLVLKG